MVFVKVRETYDLHTVRNKLSIIALHTPKANIIKRNYPGLLMQCKAYRPVSCDVRLACASVLPADPLQVSTAEGDIAPEDLFNPILYKACTNQGMSQLEAYICKQGSDMTSTSEVAGDTANVDIDPDIAISGTTPVADHFNLYYGLLQDTHSWRHASPQAGLEMTNLKPLVYEMLYSNGDNQAQLSGNVMAPSLDDTTARSNIPTWSFKANAKPMPFINTTVYTIDNKVTGFIDSVPNSEIEVPAPRVVVGAIIVPPSRLHELYYRMVVEWTLEFSSIRSVVEITNMSGISSLGNTTHYQTYDYSASKALTGVEESVLTNDTSLASASVDMNKVM